MPGVEEVKLHVAASVDDVEHAVLGIRGATERLDEALSRLRLITMGSAHPRAAEAILQLEAAREKLGEARTLAMTGMEAAQAYRMLI